MNSAKEDIIKLEHRLRSIVEDLGWNYNDLKNSENDKKMVSCPYNTEHSMPEESFKKHAKKCAWKAEGYRLDDRPLSESLPCSSSLLLTDDLQEKILREASSKIHNFALAKCELLIRARVACGDLKRPVPKTSKRLQVGFTQDERLAIYDHVVAETKREMQLKDVALTQQEDKTESKELTALELAAAQRDAKRRRATYRNKVHTSNKNHIEVLREVIHSQMTQLCDDLKGDHDAQNSQQSNHEQENPSSGNSHRDRSRSRDLYKRKQDHREGSHGKYSDDRSKTFYRNKDRYHEGRSSWEDHRHDGRYSVRSEKERMDRSERRPWRDRHRVKMDTASQQGRHSEDSSETSNSRRRSHKKQDRRSRSEQEAVNKGELRHFGERRTEERHQSEDSLKVPDGSKVSRDESDGGGNKSLTDNLLGAISFWGHATRHRSRSVESSLSGEKKKKKKKLKKERHRKHKKEKKKKKRSRSSSTSGS